VVRGTTTLSVGSLIRRVRDVGGQLGDLPASVAETTKFVMCKRTKRDAIMEISNKRENSFWRGGGLSCLLGLNTASMNEESSSRLLQTRIMKGRGRGRKT
jgi:hypothetical protein